MPAAKQARIVHIAGASGEVREQVLQPSNHALQFAGGVKFATGHSYPEMHPFESCVGCGALPSEHKTGI